MPSSQELKCPRRTANGDVALHECSEQHFRTSKTTQKTTKYHIPDDLNLQKHVHF